MEQSKETKPAVDWLFNPKRVDIRDKKTNQVVEKRPYTLYVHKGIRYYEYPVGSGNLWYEPDIEAGIQPVAAGRWVNGEVQKDVAHVEFKKPVTEADLAHQELLRERQRNAAILKELEELKLEKELSAKVEGKAETLKVGSKK